VLLENQALAGLDVFAIAARERNQGNEFFDWRGFRIHAFSDGRSSTYRGSNHPDEFSRLSAQYH
jgi:hypothetical protein